MSVRIFPPRRTHKERLHVGAGPSNREEEEQKNEDFLQILSRCPACKQSGDFLLLLPCSHPMCAPCISAEGGRPSPPPHPGEVSLLCPVCRLPVELPCWNWSDATSCLPKHPIMNTAHIRREREEDQLQHEQGDTCCRDAENTTRMGGSYAAPEGGDVELTEEEMERSVFGQEAVFCSGLFNLHRSISASSSPSLTVTPLQTQGSVYRIGVSSPDGSVGWWLERHGSSFCVVYDGSREPLCSVPPQIKTLGVFLNMGGGVLSFHNALTREHLTSLPTLFPPVGVTPALGLNQGRLRVRCGLPPPPHVFLGKDSAYRGPCGAGGGRWSREIPFQPVRKVIQKFEELAVSDSDSGLVSGSGSCCSTLASLPDHLVASL
ncbi:putative E3 ubiquitin-protein ligase MID2 [Dissostichus eleginoides]|uniref:E3 ubiquitin-protein ligase MID2 n=1 Tax=Dissostichus eleginoides TaxID=100907 RepID=A0AAD9CIK7_DISEL|nr:putative E3 ubiquitin-protein ligase MID2 [Dissostichus eleginoides]